MGKLVFWGDHSDGHREHTLKSWHFGGTEMILMLL